MMGSGGLVVMDQDTCMVDMAKFFMDFIQRESCGKCIPCPRRDSPDARDPPSHHAEPQTRTRHRCPGAVQERAAHAEPRRDDSRHEPLRGWARTAPNPVLSTLRWFRDEYEAHIYERRCPPRPLVPSWSSTRSTRKSAGAACSAPRNVRPKRSSARRSRLTTSSSTSASAAAVASIPARFGAITKQ